MAEENKVLKIVYTFFLGLLIAVFVGFGIDTFYPGPKAPEYPVIESSTPAKEPTAEEQVKQREYESASREFQNKLEPYNRNVSIIALSAAVLLLVASMVLAPRLVSVIPDGVMLGGLFTLLYSIGRGLAAHDSKYTFIVVTIGLLIVLYLGYRRFDRSHPATAKLADKQPTRQ